MTTAGANPILPWQQEFWDGFNNRLKQQRLPHALMLNTMEGVGGEHLAYAMAQKLLCDVDNSDYACGNCKACQLIGAGTHPDFIQLMPSEPGKPIVIDQIRQLSAMIAKTAQRGGWKVVIINPAESMNISASNALLKSLEEPQPNTLLILVSYRLSIVPATIRSRCQIETLTAPDRQTAKSWLETRLDKPQQVDSILDLANGRPLLAMAYLQGNGLDDRQHVEGLLDAVRRAEQSALDAAQACQKYQPDELIDWIMSYLHRLMIGELSDQKNPALFHFLDKLIEARAWILSGSTVNTQLLWESLFIEWSQVFRHQR
jgi:DNA polymerase-3 subunit delta'